MTDGPFCSPKSPLFLYGLNVAKLGQTWHKQHEKLFFAGKQNPRPKPSAGARCKPAYWAVPSSNNNYLNQYMLNSFKWTELS